MERIVWRVARNLVVVCAIFGLLLTVVASVIIDRVPAVMAGIETGRAVTDLDELGASQTGDGPALAITSPMTDAERRRVIDVAERATLKVRATSCAGSVTGSGFVWTSVGADQPPVLVTNRHVVNDASTLTVDFVEVGQDVGAPTVGHEAASTVNGVTDDADLAFAVAVPSLGLVAADEDPAQGEPVLAAGYDAGRQLTIVEASVHLYVDGTAYGIDGPVMLLDRPTSVGFSGGPVLNRRGEVVGVLQAVDAVTGLTLAIPASTVRDKLIVYPTPSSNLGNMGLCKTTQIAK